MQKETRPKKVETRRETMREEGGQPRSKKVSELITRVANPVDSRALFGEFARASSRQFP